MPNRFFDEEVFDDNQRDRFRHKDGGVSPEARQNDYRNRMPFHYVENPGDDGYYYWQYGATIDIEFTLENEVAFSDGEEHNTYISIADYFKDSDTRKLVFTLQDFRGDEITEQEVKASKLTFDGDDVKAIFRVNKRLSAMMVPGQYKLFIYIVDENLEQSGESTDETVYFNKCLTEKGIAIRVRG